MSVPKMDPMAFTKTKIIPVKGSFFICNFFSYFKTFSVSRIKQVHIFKDKSIDQSEH